MFATSRCVRNACAASLVALLGLALGCGGEEEAASPAAAPAAEAPEAAAPPSPPPPAAKVTERELPESFPKDIPLYPGAQSEVSLGMPGGPTLAAFTSSDSPETVLAFYIAELSNDGWTIEDEGGERAALKATKKNRSLNIRAGKKASGETTISISAITR